MHRASSGGRWAVGGDSGHAWGYTGGDSGHLQAHSRGQVLCTGRDSLSGGEAVQCAPMHRIASWHAQLSDAPVDVQQTPKSSACHARLGSSETVLPRARFAYSGEDAEQGCLVPISRRAELNMVSSKPGVSSPYLTLPLSVPSACFCPIHRGRCPLRVTTLRRRGQTPTSAAGGPHSKPTSQGLGASASHSICIALIRIACISGTSARLGPSTLLALLALPAAVSMLAVSCAAYRAVYCLCVPALRHVEATGNGQPPFRPNVGQRLLWLQP